MAVAKQSSTTKAATTKKATKEQALYLKAVEKISEKPTQEYYDEIMSKAGDKFTAAEKKKLKALLK